MGSERKPSKAPPISDEVRAPAGRGKDTRRWCRGKVGVEHVKSWVRDRRSIARLGRAWYILVCGACGKQFDYCTPSFRDSPCKCGQHLTGVYK